MIVKPELIKNPDWSKLTKMVEFNLNDAIKSKYWSNDVNHYIFEEVMIALYGKDFFKWFNEMDLYS